jgi:hypothetical protein
MATVTITFTDTPNDPRGEVCIQASSSLAIDNGASTKAEKLALKAMHFLMVHTKLDAMKRGEDEARTAQKAGN